MPARQQLSDKFNTPWLTHCDSLTGLLTDYTRLFHLRDSVAAHSRKGCLWICTMYTPSTFAKPPGKRDPNATGVLRLYQPVLLQEHIPLAVIGDGNCLFRDLSRGLFGKEDHHLHIRLLTAIEIITNSRYYDTEDASFHDLIIDTRLIHDPYTSVLKSITSPGSYAETMVIYAASAALRVGLQAYCPPAMTNKVEPDALTKKIYGRGVRRATAPAMIVKWTTTYVPRQSDFFWPNHFVVLYRRPKQP